MSTDMVSNLLRIVVDTNVIISSLVFGGRPKELVEKIIQRKFKAFISPVMLSELSDVLRKKFDFSEEKIRKLEEEMLDKFEVVYPTKEVFIARDKSDNKILEAAIESKSKFIISGDKDLLVLKNYLEIEILTPSGFLSLYEKDLP